MTKKSITYGCFGAKCGADGFHLGAMGIIDGGMRGTVCGRIDAGLMVGGGGIGAGLMVGGGGIDAGLIVVGGEIGAGLMIVGGGRLVGGAIGRLDGNSTGFAGATGGEGLTVF